MKVLLLILLFVISSINVSYAQTNTFPVTGSAGIGTITPDGSALLDMQSSTQGMLVPRMTKAQRNSIAVPATGLLIYQTNTQPGFYYYDGSSWKALKSQMYLPGTGISIIGSTISNTLPDLPVTINGDTGIDVSGAYPNFSISIVSNEFANVSLSNLDTTAINNSMIPGFDGSIDLGSEGHSWRNIYLNGAVYLDDKKMIDYNGGNQLFFGDSSGYSNIGNYNTAFGNLAMKNNTSGHSNSAFGYSSLWANTSGWHNSAFGQNVLKSNTSGNDNSAFGSQSLYSNTTGSANSAFGRDALYSNLNGVSNTAVGYVALTDNTYGSDNSAFGTQALTENIGGNRNCAFGKDALFHNNSGSDNSAFGVAALGFNTGSYNSAFGKSAMFENTSGTYNVGVGFQALYHNVSAMLNVAIGRNALFENNANGNTAIGSDAGNFPSNSYNCVYLGYDSDQSSDDTFNNSMAAGHGSRITASNQVRLGNALVTSIGGFQNWTNISDGRYKFDVSENVAGLKFINALHPVTYHLDISELNKKLGIADSSSNQQLIEENEKIVYSGFIAQEVEAAAIKSGYDFSGVDAPENENDLYGLRYADFTVPLVKAVQELSDLNQEKAEQISKLEERIAKLESLFQYTTFVDSIQEIKLSSDNSVARLDQNIPNPSNGKTIINYFVPESSLKAQIRVTSQNGIELITSDVNKGEGTLWIDATLLTAGNYYYSLIVDGAVVKTRTLILVK